MAEANEATIEDLHPGLLYKIVVEAVVSVKVRVSVGVGQGQTRNRRDESILMVFRGKGGIDLAKPKCQQLTELKTFLRFSGRDHDHERPRGGEAESPHDARAVDARLRAHARAVRTARSHSDRCVQTRVWLLRLVPDA